MFPLGHQLTTKLNVPRVHNVISDPKEEYDLVNIDQSTAWILSVVLDRVVKFKGSLMKEPPIRLGTPDPCRPPARKM